MNNQRDKRFKAFDDLIYRLDTCRENGYSMIRDINETLKNNRIHLDQINEHIEKIRMVNS